MPAAYGKGNAIYRRLGRRVRPGRLAALDGVHAGRPGSVCCAAGAPTNKEADSALGRIRDGFRTQPEPFRPGPAHAPQPRNPNRYPARHAVAWGRDWLKHGQRVATRDDPYAHRCLGFLYWAAAWIWLNLNLNIT